jgi:hypothetical protein
VRSGAAGGSLPSSILTAEHRWVAPESPIRLSDCQTRLLCSQQLLINQFTDGMQQELMPFLNARG